MKLSQNVVNLFYNARGYAVLEITEFEKLKCKIMNIENRLEREYNKETGKTRYNELEEPCENYVKWLENKLVNSSNVIPDVVVSTGLTNGNKYYLFQYHDEETKDGEFKPCDVMEQECKGFKTLFEARNYIEYLDREDLLPCDREYLMILKLT